MALTIELSSSSASHIGELTYADDAGQQVDAAERVQPGESEHPGVLQVALRPAPVARGIVEDVRRHLFPAADELGELPHLIAGAAHERRLDEVVTEDLTAQRRLARQVRQQRSNARRARRRRMALWPQ